MIRVFFGLLVMSVLTGCAERSAVKQSAQTLQHSMLLYEQRLDALINDQQQYYKTRSDEYRQAHALLLTEGGQQKIFQQAAELADRFSAAESKVNVSDLITFLRSSDQTEYDLQTTIRKDLSDKEAEFQASLRDLERDRDTATLVRQNLGRIAQKKSLKDEIEDLKDYGQEVQGKLEESKGQKSK